TISLTTVFIILPSSLIPIPLPYTPFPYTTLFRSRLPGHLCDELRLRRGPVHPHHRAAPLPSPAQALPLGPHRHPARVLPLRRVRRRALLPDRLRSRPRAGAGLPRARRRPAAPPVRGQPPHLHMPMAIASALSMADNTLPDLLRA